LRYIPFMTDAHAAPSDHGQLDPARFANAAAPGRDCGTCTLCCKVYDVPTLAKPVGKWCSHCTPGKGCGIHETRPVHCRSFFCLWMTDAHFTPEWKPDRCKFVMSVDPVTRFLNIQVDPGSPNAWRTEPYHRQLVTWARQMVAEERFVIVFLNKAATIVLPDKEVSLGVLGETDRLIPYRQVTPNGVTYAFDVVRDGARATKA
jgi:hypothetical protein